MLLRNVVSPQAKSFMFSSTRCRVWTGRIVLGPRGRPLPQPVRFVTWVLISLCTWNWLGAVLDGIGHRAQSDIPPGPLAAGFVFFGLNVLIQSRRRSSYVLVIAVMASFVVSGLVQTQWSVGTIVEIPYTVFVLLLVIGWKRYVALIAGDRRSLVEAQGEMIFGRRSQSARARSSQTWSPQGPLPTLIDVSDSATPFGATACSGVLGDRGSRARRSRRVHPPQRASVAPRPIETT